MKSRYLFLWLVVIGLGGLALWYWAYTLMPANPNDANPLIEDLGKTGASLSLISVIGGLVKWILQEREKQTQEKQQEVEFYSNVLDDLKSVYDQVERARLLIEAHRTAKTYGEQMRQLIGGVVTLHNIKRAVQTRTNHSNCKESIFSKNLESPVDAMTKYIKDLLKEYRENYKRISILQEIDEERKKLYVEKKGKTESENTKVDLKLVAWKELEALPKLHELRDDSIYDRAYNPLFISHLVSATAQIRSKLKTI